MAKPVTLPFGSFLLKVGDGATPEVFVAPCGFTQRSLQLTANTNTTQVPDCDDPDAPSWDEADVSSMSGQINGQGVLAKEAFPIWNEWFLSGAPRNIRAEYKGLGHYEGTAILTSLQFDSNIGEKIAINVTIQNSGEWTFVEEPAGP